MVGEDLLAIGLFERRHALKVLMIVSRHGPITKQDMISELGVGTNVPMARVRELKAAGLIEEDVEALWPHAHMLKITAKGRDVAEIVERMIGRL
jgi:chromosome segregation and condensation protein ScpB